MKSKWLYYYQNISVIYLLGLIFYSRCKLDYLSDYLETYYKYLALTFDVFALVRNVRQLFYPLHDGYAKFNVHPLILILNKMPLQLKLQPA